MMQSAQENEDDMVALTFMLIGGLSTGAFSFGVIFNPVREWMVQYHLLAAEDQVVIPFVDGIGFGWAQILVALGLVAAIIMLAFWLRRRSRERV